MTTSGMELVRRYRDLVVAGHVNRYPGESDQVFRRSDEAWAEAGIKPA